MPSLLDESFHAPLSRRTYLSQLYFRVHHRSSSSSRPVVMNENARNYISRSSYHVKARINSSENTMIKKVNYEARIDNMLPRKMRERLEFTNFKFQTFPRLPGGAAVFIVRERNECITVSRLFDSDDVNNPSHSTASQPFIQFIDLYTYTYIYSILDFPSFLRATKLICSSTPSDQFFLPRIRNRPAPRWRILAPF